MASGDNGFGPRICVALRACGSLMRAVTPVANDPSGGRPALVRRIRVSRAARIPNLG
jgi:hypothetical protein